MVKTLKEKIVIVGAGIAALSAIKVIRDVDKEIEIDLISNEEFYPYNRIKLTKNLFENISEESILLQKKEWYKENNINLYISKEVIKIDEEGTFVLLNDNHKIEFSKLLLASGAHNFKLPIDGIEKLGVYTIRQLKDVMAIEEALKYKKKPLVIGGGIQGLETAFELSKECNEVIIAEMQERLMMRQLDEKASKILYDAIEKSNIKVHLNAQINKIEGDVEVSYALKSDKEKIDCDMIIYNAGIRPNISYLKDSKVKLKSGIIVNDRMETNVKNIYAAGDVCEFNGKISGAWSIATEQGKVAGHNMINIDKTYKNIIPVTMLNAFDISLFSMGCVEENVDYSLIEEKDDKSYKRLFIKNEKIVGAIVVGDSRKSPILKSAIEKQINLSEFDLSRIFIDYKKV